MSDDAESAIKAARHALDAAADLQRPDNPPTFELPGDGPTVEVRPPSHDLEQRVTDRAEDNTDEFARYLCHCTYLEGQDVQPFEVDKHLEQIRELPSVEDGLLSRFIEAFLEARSQGKGMTSGYAMRQIAGIAEDAQAQIDEEPDDAISPDNKEELTRAFSEIEDVCEEFAGNLP